MEYKDLENMVEKLFNDIFKENPLSSLSEYDRRFCIYDYVTDYVIYDYDLLAKKKQRQIKTDSFQEVIDVFQKRKGVCNSIAQGYKLLLEKAGINVVAVFCHDDGDDHQLCLVKQGDSWSFDDPTKGVLVGQNQKWEHFDYDYVKATQEKQEMIGVLSEVYYDKVFKRDVKRKDNGFQKVEGTGGALYKLPINIRSTKNDINNKTTNSSRHI